MRWYHDLGLSIIYHVIVIGIFMYVTPSFEELRARRIKIRPPVTEVISPFIPEPLPDPIPDAIAPNEDPFEVEPIETPQPEFLFAPIEPSPVEPEHFEPTHAKSPEHIFTTTNDDTQHSIDSTVSLDGNTQQTPAFHSSVQGIDTNPPTTPTTDSSPTVPILSSTHSKEWQNYVKELSRHFKERKFYPEAARKLRLSGTVWITVVIQNDGSCVDARIDKSSGYPILDQAALQSAKSAFPVPPFPSGTPIQNKTIQIPYHYQLSDN